MSLLTTLGSVLFRPRAELTNDGYLRASWLLSPVAVIAVVVDQPVSVLLSNALQEVVPKDSLPSLSTPPVLEFRSQAAAAWLLGMAAMLLLGACLAIAIQEGLNLEAAIARTALLQRARVIATVWLLIVAATQVGSLRQLGIAIRASGSEHLPSARSLTVGAIALVVLGAFVISLAVWGWRRLDVDPWTLWGRIRPVAELALTRIAALVTLPVGVTTWVVLWPLYWLALPAPWLVSVTPQSARRGSRAMETMLPTGAVELPDHRQL